MKRLQKNITSGFCQGPQLLFRRSENIPENIPQHPFRADNDDFRHFVLTHAPALAQLLDVLDAGLTPDWLQVLAAISQGVEYLTDDNTQACRETGPGEMPQDSYCRSC